MVLDGLNERPDQPWANLINSFAQELADLGGALILTCRPGFWRREVEPRLSEQLDYQEITVKQYTPAEVDQLLIQRGYDPGELSGQLKRFLLNPRVCGVALSFLSQLGAAPGELTVERLQLEYWQQRMKERGNLVQHSAREFLNVLRAHAEQWLLNKEGRFLLDSAVSRSTKPRAVAMDLSDIIEGRFMQMSSDQEDIYEFLAEALPFALGLLLNKELSKPEGNAEVEYAQTIDLWIEPIRAFDITSKIVASAFSLACLDQKLSLHAKRALLNSWVSLQNLDDESVEAMVPNVRQTLWALKARTWHHLRPAATTKPA